MALGFNGGTNVITGLATGGLPDGSVDTDSLATSVNVFREVDQWRITSNLSTSNDWLDENWERNDTNFSKIGTGVEVDTGAFSFPNTGIWLIQLNMVCYYSNNDRRYNGGQIYATTNNSSYAEMANSYSYMGDASYAYASTHTQIVLDVTDVSNQKVKFKVEASGTVYFMGNSDYNRTCATFIKLGAT